MCVRKPPILTAVCNPDQWIRSSGTVHSVAVCLPARSCVWIAFTITDAGELKSPKCIQSYCEPTQTHTHTHTHTDTHRCEKSAVSKFEQTNSQSNCSVQHMQLSVNVKRCVAQHVYSLYRTTALTPSVPHYRPYALCNALQPLFSLCRTSDALCTALHPLRSLYRTTALKPSIAHYRPYALCTALPPLGSL